MNKEVVLTPIPSKYGFSSYLCDTINGRIFSKKSNKYLSAGKNDNGYVYNTLIDDNGKAHSYGVHRLVMASCSGIALEHFKRGEIEVDHYPKEDEKWNNRIDNLKMSSRKAQYRESTRAKMGKGKRLTEDEVRKILYELKEWKANGNNKLSDFIHIKTKEVGQGYRNIWNIVTGKTWRHLHKEV